MISNVATTYLLPIMPYMNLQSGMTPTYIQLPYGAVCLPQTGVTKRSLQVITNPQKIITNPQKTTYTSTVGSVGSLREFSPNNTMANNIIRVSPSTNSFDSSKTVNDCALKGIKINNITKVATKVQTTDSSTKTSTTIRKPDIKTYSKFSPNDKTKQNENNEKPSDNSNKLCAKIITNEAALAALSAIANSSSANKTTEEDNHFVEGNEEYILPNENSMSADDSSNNAVNSYVINTLEKQLAPNVTLNSELSNIHSSLLPNSRTYITPMTNSSIVSQNPTQKSNKLIESHAYISGVNNESNTGSPKLKVVQQNNLNKNKNIVHITIDD